MLDQRKNPHTGRTEYCLVSISEGRVLKWFGPKKPSEEKIQEEEDRINYFKHKRK